MTEPSSEADPVTLLHVVDDPARLAAIRAALGPGPLREHDLRSARVAPCVGCFQCWTKTPGRCRAKDAGNAIMRDVIASGLQVWAGPIRFGTWDPSLKKALDKCIGLLSPFFAELHGETHHQPRYARYPRWLAIGLADPATTEAERAAFQTLARRQALNVLAPARAVVIVEPERSLAELEAEVRAQVAALWAIPDDAPPPPIAASPAPRPSEQRARYGGGGSGRRTAVLLVGSAKAPGTSSSEHLGARLVARLIARGWQARIVHLARVHGIEASRPERLRAAIVGADLLVLATPVYVDSLPALVGSALQALIEAGPTPALAAIVQCGFPEVEHTWLAVEALRLAAARGGWPWLGALAFGGGMAIAERTIPIHERALELAADALDQGAGIPAEALELCARPIMQPWVYRLAGSVGWIAGAWRDGALTQLRARPFAELVAPARAD